MIHTAFQWGRIQSNADWILPVAACVAIFWLVGYLYRRDAVELRRWVGRLLCGLRMAAFFGLLVLFLQPQWRSQREVARNSRVLVAVDVSLSMGTIDDPSLGKNRSEQIVAALQDSDLLDRLRQVHDVVVVPFAEELWLDRAVTLGKRAEDGGRRAEKDNVDWGKVLAPVGVETRLGQALRQLIQAERGGPVSGIVLMSDGAQNAGPSVEPAVEAAQDAKIPLFPIGLGSNLQPAGVRVCDLTAPMRAYPGDRYTVTGYVQAQGMAGKSVEVELFQRHADQRGDDLGRRIESRQILLGADGETLPVRFELKPEAPGRHTLCFRVQSSPGDPNPADNRREADVEIVDRKNQILLLAGGPSREYQFLRNLLFRDSSTEVDVLLQSGSPGLSQECRKILDRFPSTRAELFGYDCLVAFDPDWQALAAAQVDLLEQWVGRQGGGLIVIAGSAHAGRGIDGWTQNPAMGAIRNLYPVEFLNRLASLESNTYSSAEPWPLEFTREGRQSDYLRLGETATASRRAWESLPGVYSCLRVRGPKPGAAALAMFSDPRAAAGGRQPVYFASQFYGAGSVFYLGSGEMWRLRAVDEAYFEQFYTKLIRQVSQGRLLRGSPRGALVVAQDRYMLGATVEVRAQLSDPRLEPLAATSVTMQVFEPDSTARAVVLRSDPSRVGAYEGRFPVLREGTYRIELPLSDSDQRLVRRIQCSAPELERENPRRNDPLLSALAQQSGGHYFVEIPKVEELSARLDDRTTTVIQPIATNPRREELWRRVIMISLCSALCLEWLIRRLSKLA